MIGRRRQTILVVAALLTAALCVRLGVWQLHRLRDRRARNAAIAAARARPPVTLPAPGVPAESLFERRVKARGEYDARYQRMWRPRMYDGTPGAALLAPLRLSDGSAVLVDRGWIEAVSAAALARTAPPIPEGPVAIEGFALRGPRGLGDVDPRRLADSVPYPLLPVIVQLVPGAPGAAAGPGAPIPVALAALDDGPHRSYAVQWFSFALIVLVGTALLLRKERHSVASGGPPPPTGS